MKLCFSTLGCPNWTWNEILTSAKDLSYNGIELRGIGEDIFLPKVDLFAPENILVTQSDLKNLGLTIPCVTSDVMLHKSDRDYIASGRLYIALAANIGAKYVRVLGDASPAPSPNIDENIVADRLRILAPIALASGVTLLVETNGIYADTAKLARLIEEINSPAVRVLWDINHPVRYFRETPEVTYANIGKYTKHIHIKDSIIADGKIQYKMLGYGDLPINSCLKLLKSNNYDGFISLEWTKRWNSELEDAGIVFSHFAYTIKNMWKNA